EHGDRARRRGDRRTAGPSTAAAARAREPDPPARHGMAVRPAGGAHRGGAVPAAARRAAGHVLHGLAAARGTGAGRAGELRLDPRRRPLRRGDRVHPALHRAGDGPHLRHLLRPGRGLGEPAARRGVLPDGVLPPLRRRHRCGGAHLVRGGQPPDRRHGAPGARRRADRRLVRLPRHPGQGAVDDAVPGGVEVHRLPGGRARGRPAVGARGAVRGGPHGRGQQPAAAALDHPAVPAAHARAAAGALGDRLAARLRPVLRADRRRARPQHRHARLRDLPDGVHLVRPRAGGSALGGPAARPRRRQRAAAARAAPPGGL
ncbi:MAG: ABC transporter, permease protein 1 (cluster 1, maltose/g3p/polyamine/iron), partial [uncultured Quadrisphaera sp.]